MSVRLFVAGVLGGVVLGPAASAQSLPQPAFADGFVAGSVLLHARGVAVIPEPSSEISVIGGHAGVSTTFIPELDATYFLTPHFAAELIAGVTRHSVHAEDTAIGTVGLGRIWLLPPTLTGQYHVQASHALDLYAGAGINYTFFLGPDLPSGGPVTSIHW